MKLVDLGIEKLNYILLFIEVFYAAELQENITHC